jgi:hypothetical protein
MAAAILFLAPAAAMLMFGERAWNVLPGIPYSVDSRFTEFEPDGSTVNSHHFATSYSTGGKEISLSHTFPTDAFRTVIRTSLDAAGLLLFFTVTQPLDWLRRGTAEASDFPGKGCVVPGRDLLARETILGYETVVVQAAYRQVRTTIWRAPRLDCFPLRITQEIRRGDAWVRRFERTAVRVRQHN